jgi:ABC-type branched-subunit amino acid transport system substrate-binding protein
MDTALNNPVQYPTFARSHTDVAGFGEMSVSYLAENLGVKHAGLFVPNDSYGLSFQKHVLDAARYHGVEIIAVQYLETSEEDIIVNLRALKKTGFNYFIGAFDAQNFAKTMGLAYREGVAGPGRFWLASGAAGTAPALLSGSLTLETN